MTTPATQEMPPRHKLPASFARSTVALSLTVFLLSVGLFAWPGIRTYMQAAIILLDWNGEQPPKLLFSLAAMKVRTQEVSIATPQGLVSARLYTPVGKPNAPGFVLVHGLSPKGMNLERFERLAALNASTGLSVLTPDLVTVRDYHVDNSVIDAIGSSARWLANKTGHPVTMMGISYGGGLALMAAGQSQYAAYVRTVVSVGGYDDLSRVAQFYATAREPRANGTMETEEPFAFGYLLLESYNLDLFVPPADLPTIRPLLEATLFDEHERARQLESQLTPSQRQEWLNLQNRRAEQPLLMQVAARHAAEFAAISPRGHVGAMTAQVYILHGVEDNYVPVAEVGWLLGDLPPGTPRRVLVSPIVSHIALGGKAHMWIDKWLLLQFVASELRSAQMG